MQYAILPTNRDIVHWGKGKQAKQHKYVDRKMGPNGKWIYYYTKKPTSIKARLGVYAKENLEQAKTKERKTLETATKTKNNAYSNKMSANIERSKWESGEYFDKEDHTGSRGLVGGSGIVGGDNKKGLVGGSGIRTKKEIERQNIVRNQVQNISRLNAEIAAYDDIMNYANAAKTKRGLATKKAYEAYASTPLGKIEELGSAIKDVYDSGTYWLKKKLKIW